MVSVCMITYNHEKFIAQAIEGVLMQKTSFPIELIISDDCSPDNTKAIIERYAKENPSIIKPIYRNPNIGVMPNFIDSLKRCSGKYIAYCDGDDYWTDPLKLQKQVECLENDPNCSIVCTDFITIDENGNEIYDEFYTIFQKPRVKSGYVFWDLLERNFISTQTVLARREYIQPLFSEVIKKWYAIDRWWWLNITFKHEIIYLDIKTTKYRRHSAGITYTGFIQKADPNLEYDILKKYVLNGKIQLTQKQSSILNSKIHFLLNNPNLILAKKIGIIWIGYKYKVDLIKMFKTLINYYL